jgi:uncharacterized protein (TIGR00369 family)
MSEKLVIDLEPWQQAFVDAVFSSTYYQWTGCELRTLREGAASVRVQPPPGIVTPWGGMNGAVVGSLLELPASLAVVWSLDEGQSSVTNDLFVQHMKPIPGTAEVIFEGRMVRRGRTMAWCESAALVDGKPHSLARVTKTILEG